MTIHRPILCLLFLCVSIAAQQVKFRHALPPETTIARRTVVFAHDAGGDLKADLYRPANSKEKLPIIIFVNVVGRLLGSAPFREHPQYQGWGRAATTIGTAGVVMESGENPSANFDQLISYLRAHAAELNLDPDQTVVWSCSANVQLGLPLITDPARKYIRAGIVYYGTGKTGTFRSDISVLLVRAGLDSPSLNHGLEETAAAALKENAPWTVINVAGGHHGFDGLDDNVESTEVISQTLAFAQRALRHDFQAAISERQVQAEAAGLVNSAHWAEAATAYQKILAANPGDDMAHWRLAQVLVEQGKDREAIPHFQQALDLGNMNRGLISMQAAKSAMATGDKEAALKFLESLKGIKVMTSRAKADPAFTSLQNDPRFKAIVGEN